MAARLSERERNDRRMGSEMLREHFAAEARSRGWKVMHVSDSRIVTNVGGRLVLAGDPECKGWPDLFLAHPAAGLLLAVECKREIGDEPTDDQDEWLDVLDLCDVQTFVLKPSGWERGLELLDRAGQPAVITAA